MTCVSFVGPVGGFNLFQHIGQCEFIDMESPMGSSPLRPATDCAKGFPDDGDDGDTTADSTSELLSHHP